MAKLKIFTSLDKESWETLNEIAEKEVSLIHIEREYPEKIFRTYCKCGYVAGSLQDTCPECGNKVDKTYTINSSGRLIRTNIFLEKETMKNSSGILEKSLVGYSQEFVANVTTSKELEFRKKARTKDFEVCSNNGFYHNPRNEYKLKDILNEYEYSIDGFNKYHNQSVSGFFEYVNYKTDFPVLIENLGKYPHIVNHILHRTKVVMGSPFSKISSWEEVYKLLNIPNKSLYPYINNLYKERGYYYWGRTAGVETEAFKEYEDLSNELKEVADYMLIHGKISIENFKRKCTDLKTIKPEHIDALKVYVRSNYVTMGINVVDNFLSTVSFLEKRDMEVCPTTVDTRNLNLIKNKEFITTNKKYNEKRTVAFLDMFDLNPLESLQYLDNRRAPSKELKKQIAEKLD